MAEIRLEIPDQDINDGTDLVLDLEKMHPGPDPRPSCPHAVFKENRLMGIPPHQQERAIFVTPRAIEAWNQGGHDGTMVCLDCVLDALKTYTDKEKNP